jgi:hypothetical protein
MTDAPFVAAGWIGTAGVIVLYTASVVARTRRARRGRPLPDRSDR